MATGYAIGALVGWLARAAGVHVGSSAVARRRAWVAIGVVACVVAAASTALGGRWQGQLRSLFGRGDAQFVAEYVLVPVVAVIFVAGTIVIARLIRAGVRRVAAAAGLERGSSASRLVGAAAGLVGAGLVVSGVGGAAAMAAVKTVSQAVDSGTDEDVVRPQEPERSGSPVSASAWDELGRQGRQFVASGPTQEELADFWADEGVSEPIRVYAGLQSAESLELSAALVVDELDRTGAWERELLVVVATTGSGWVDPAMADAVETMFRGDTAIAAMQYTHMPSWAAFATDRDLPPKAAKVFFDAVHTAWSDRPAADRPDLYVFGESIGSYGGQDAFDSLAELTESVDGALWVGTPHTSRTWQDLTAARDLGTPEAAPIYDAGRQVRWSVAPNEVYPIGPAGVAWDRPRVLYLQHPSDAVTWWSTDLAWQEPDWLREPRGDDVLDDLHYLPVVTLWQVTFDLTHAANVPAGHGHKYWFEYIDAWARLTDPPDWSDADRERLYEMLAELAVEEDVILPDHLASR
jgi:uncharacterized membrane protein